MFKIFGPLIAALIVGFPATVARAVTGSLSSHISLAPQMTTAEKVPFEIDFQMGLDLALAVGSLKFSLASIFGITGVEHAVFELKAQLDVLTIRDEFVFARPFSNRPSPFTPGCGPPMATGSLATGLPPCPHILPVGPLLFVKKRVTTAIKIGDITIENLAMFEDINFSAPLVSIGRVSRHTVLTGGAVPRPAADPNKDNQYNQQDQHFRFGDILIVKGITSGGIKITAISAFNADWQRWNCIKKKCFRGTVIENIEELAFFEENLSIDNIIVGPIRLDVFLSFSPGPRPAFNRSLEASFTLSPLAKVRLFFFDRLIEDPLSLSLSDPPFPPFYAVAIEMATSLGSLTLLPDERLNLRRVELFTRFRLDPAPATSSLTASFRWDTPRVSPVPVSRGLVKLEASLAIDLGGGAHFVMAHCFGGHVVRTQWLVDCADKGDAGDAVTFQFTRFSLAVKAEALDIETEATLLAEGMHHTKLRLTLSF